MITSLCLFFSPRFPRSSLVKADRHQANTLEEQLSTRLTAISQNLHVSLRAHSRQAHEDVATALLENARLTIGYHKHLLRELEALRPELAKVGSTTPSMVSTTTVAGPATPSKAYTSAPAPAPAPQMAASRPYHSPPRHTEPTLAEGSRSMVLPPPPTAQATPPRAPQPQPVFTQVPSRDRDPLAGAPPQGAQGPMAQSMMLPPHQNGQARQTQTQTVGRTQGRRLDERQAAKMLAGGF